MAHDVCIDIKRLNDLVARYKKVGGLDAGDYSEMVRLLLQMFNKWIDKTDKECDQYHHISFGIEKEVKMVAKVLRPFDGADTPYKEETPVSSDELIFDLETDG